MSVLTMIQLTSNSRDADGTGVIRFIHSAEMSARLDQLLGLELLLLLLNCHCCRRLPINTRRNAYITVLLEWTQTLEISLAVATDQTQTIPPRLEYIRLTTLARGNL